MKVFRFPPPKHSVGFFSSTRPLQRFLFPHFTGFFPSNRPRSTVFFSFKALCSASPTPPIGIPPASRRGPTPPPTPLELQRGLPPAHDYITTAPSCYAVALYSIHDLAPLTAATTLFCSWLPSTSTLRPDLGKESSICLFLPLPSPASSLSLPPPATGSAADWRQQGLHGR
jgi:hypothetical protein